MWPLKSNREETSKTPAPANVDDFGENQPINENKLTTISSPTQEWNLLQKNLNNPSLDLVQNRR